MRSSRISKRVLASPGSIVVTLGTEGYGIVMVMWLLGPISDGGSYPDYSNTSVFVDFGYRRFFFSEKFVSFFAVCLRFRRCAHVTSLLILRGEKKNSEGASSYKCEAEKFMSESKDYEKAEGFIPQQVFNCDETGLF
ncbi:hypothetical protein AVEN_144792-1 [Araneus ventricosus]|uniref:Uncharacterized protein n=1 Tax=Araneus ventricosus TaxID=182803 RepID=A0A4Y2UES4_ARAVE|nr:hypothetical protein AVEN_144792-1 [Araneus ventricosus]